jgi:hypothetical protein
MQQDVINIQNEIYYKNLFIYDKYCLTLLDQTIPNQKSIKKYQK